MPVYPARQQVHLLLQPVNNAETDRINRSKTTGFPLRDGCWLSRQSRRWKRDRRSTGCDCRSTRRDVLERRLFDPASSASSVLRHQRHHAFAHDERSAAVDILLHSGTEGADRIHFGSTRRGEEAELCVIWTDRRCRSESSCYSAFGYSCSTSLATFPRHRDSTGLDSTRRDTTRLYTSRQDLTTRDDLSTGYGETRFYIPKTSDHVPLLGIKAHCRIAKTLCLTAILHDCFTTFM